jgi:hypothetical protein
MIDELELASSLGLSPYFVLRAKVNYALSLVTHHKTTTEIRLNKIAACRRKIRIFNKHARYFKHALLNHPEHAWYLEIDLLDCYNQIERNQRTLSFLTSRHIEGRQPISYDIASIKQIPINTLVEVNSAGFFKVRDEKTPSCKWYKDENVWVDFGGDNRKHDNIDLYCILYKCDVKTALRELSKIS